MLMTGGLAQVDDATRGTRLFSSHGDVAYAGDLGEPRPNGTAHHLDLDCRFFCPAISSLFARLEKNPEPLRIRVRPFANRQRWILLSIFTHLTLQRQILGRSPLLLLLGDFGSGNDMPRVQDTPLRLSILRKVGSCH